MFVPVEPDESRPHVAILTESFNRAINDGLEPVSFTVGSHRDYWLTPDKPTQERKPLRVYLSRFTVPVDADGTDSPDGRSGFLCNPL